MYARKAKRCYVLILVIAVDGLGVVENWSVDCLEITVLILVIAVDGLGVRCARPRVTDSTCLNPCYSGRWSRSVKVDNLVISVDRS